MIFFLLHILRFAWVLEVFICKRVEKIVLLLEFTVFLLDNLEQVLLLLFQSEYFFMIFRVCLG
jgi:hypothetical protein